MGLALTVPGRLESGEGMARPRDGPLGALVPAVRRSKKNASYSSLTCIHHGSMGQEAFQCVYIWW